MNIYIETFGCSCNINESGIMAGLLTRSGYTIVRDAKNADVIIINTCSVKSTTEQKILYKIKQLRKKKKLIITGCMPESMYEKTREAAPDASMVSTHHITDIVKAVKNVAEGKKIELLGKTNVEKLCLPKIQRSKVIDIVPISSGCLSACTYCSTKLAKGELFSYSKEKIIQEIESAKKAGYKEFWLTGQDCSCYGFDNNENLAGLLNKITAVVKGRYFLRVGMLNPLHVKKILSQLIDAYKNEHVFKFLHIPVQSGSNKILKLMGRGYNVDDFISIVRKFRSSFPTITIWTDVIVGFPDEEEDDFQATIDLLNETKPDFINISAFGPRPHTKAASMPQVKTEIKKERTRKITEIVSNMCLEANKKWLNWSGTAIIDEYNSEKQNFIARNLAYKPIVIKNKDIKLGDIVNVRIISAEKTHLNGELI